jgi:hypothetical protein
VLINLREKIIPEYVRSYSPTLIKWLLIGYLIRLVLIPITVSSDLVNNGFQATFLYSRGYWLPANDPPLYFFIYAGWLKLFNPVMPFGIFWDIPSHINFGTNPNQWSTSLLLRLSDPHLYSFLLTSKALFLIPDCIIAIALLHLADKPAEGLFSFKFWMGNPVVIFVSYVIGQYDIYVAVFLTLALVAAYKRRYLSAAACLGLGAAFKTSLLLLVPLPLFPLVARQKSSVSKLTELAKGLMLSALPLALSYLSLIFVPTYTAGYNLSTYSPTFPIFGLLLSRTITFTTNSGFNDYVFAFVLFYFLLMIFYYLKGNYSYDFFWRISLGIFLFFFALSFFHAQWLLWVQPLLVIAVAKYRRLLGLFAAILIGFAGYLMYFDAILTTDLFSPLNSAILSMRGPLEIIASAGLPTSLVLGIFRTLISAGSIGIAVFILAGPFLQRTSND